MRRVDTGQSTPDLHEQVRQADLIREVTQHPGWQVFIGALEQHERKQMTVLLKNSASENAADYAKKLGELNGLRLAPTIAEQAIARGVSAANELRSQTVAEEASAA